MVENQQTLFSAKNFNISILPKLRIAFVTTRFFIIYPPILILHPVG